ncbi:hypothetical protein PSP6_80142 [Paraburkholderia tropica]|nr:hypothetical protein PSP6_80142 [Paraburkholderia tropica]
MRSRLLPRASPTMKLPLKRPRQPMLPTRRQPPTLPFEPMRLARPPIPRAPSESGLPEFFAETTSSPIDTLTFVLRKPTESLRFVNIHEKHSHLNFSNITGCFGDQETANARPPSLWQPKRPAKRGWEWPAGGV